MLDWFGWHVLNKGDEPSHVMDHALIDANFVTQSPVASQVCHYCVNNWLDLSKWIVFLVPFVFFQGFVVDKVHESSYLVEGIQNTCIHHS